MSEDSAHASLYEAAGSVPSPFEWSPVREALFMPPSVVVAGLGHSGTTIVTRMLIEMGWDALDADEEFAESVRFRDFNEHAWREGYLPAEAWRWAETLPRRFVLKDPRLCVTLSYWKPVFVECRLRPFLLWVHRPLEKVLESHRRRGRQITGESLIFGMRLVDQLDLMAVQFEQWPWGRFRLEFEHFARAVRMFDPERALGRS